MSSSETYIDRASEPNFGVLSGECVLLLRTYSQDGLMVDLFVDQSM